MVRYGARQRWELKSNKMKKVLWSIVSLLFAAKIAIAADPKTIMLVLGSADPQVLKDRIAVAARLYRTQSFQKIIVSGGCGAHGSGICEASAMQQGLVAMGVDPQKIYKEENAKTTVQNYVFSRLLRDELDERIIQPKDTVYVVSNHWHAISVAARLQQHDGVIAKFYIEGALVPKESDKLDYVGIFNAQPDNEKFVMRGSWLTPAVVWSRAERIFYLTNHLVYGTDPNNTSFTLRKDTEELPFLVGLDPQHSTAFIDAGKYWWVRNGDQLLKVDKETYKVVERRSWSSWIKGMPEAWRKGAFNSGVIWNNNLLLFANEKLLIAKIEKKGMQFVDEHAAADYFTNWPFSWGQCNVSAATLDSKTEELILYRNMETVKVNKGGAILGKPEPLKLKWIDELK